MSSKATVGSLRVMLGLDSAQFTAGLTKAQVGLQKFGALAKTGALAIGAAMVTAGGAVAVAMRGMIDEADSMSKLAQSIGVPIDELSRLRYAASLADVDLEALGKGLKRLSASMFEAGQNATGSTADSFAMLGISVRNAEGQMRPVTGVVEDLAARFARMPDGVEKTALAMKIFGKSGADLIPLLNSGADGLAEMYAEAEELGVVLDTETGAAAERFNDNLTRLGTVKDGIITKITAGMLPALAGLTDGLVIAARNSDLLRRMGGALGNVLRFLAISAVTAGGFFMALAHDIKTTAQVAFLWSTQQYTAAIAVADNGDRVRARTLAGIQRINAAIASSPMGNSGGGVPPAAEALNEISEAGARGARAARGRTDEEKELQEAMQESARVFEQTRTPLEKYNAELERLMGLRDRGELRGGISGQTFDRAAAALRSDFDQDDPLTRAGNQFRDDLREKRQRDRDQRREDARDYEEDMRQATYDGISDGLHAAADGNLVQYLAAKLKEKLIDGLADALTNMLRGPKGSSGGGAMGWLSAVGSMFRTGLPGFATGGSFTVGGQAGMDKNLVAFRATKGEMVDIRRPGQDMGGGAMAVHVTPSPYFDVQVQKIAGPIAQQAAGHMGRSVLDASRRGAPGLQQRQRRLGTV